MLLRMMAICGWTWTLVRVSSSMMRNRMMSAVVIPAGLLSLAGWHVAVSPSFFLPFVPTRRTAAGAMTVAISIMVTVVMAHAVMITMIAVFVFVFREGGCRKK
jgi:hypothetical protein